jgi:hypothetical protein
MMGVFFRRIERWVIPEAGFEDSLREMALDGARGREGIVLWLGHRREGCGELTHLVRLRGLGVIRRADFLQIDASLINDVTDLSLRLGVTLIGQIHSHGPGDMTDLSITDHFHGIRVQSYLSVVAPYYGTIAGTRILDCGVHVYELPNGYRRMSDGEIAQRIMIIRGSRPEWFTVGEET